MRRVQKGTARLPWSPIITKKIDLFGWIWIWGNLIGASQTSDECHQDMFQCCGVRCDAKLEHVKDYCAYWVILQRNTQLYKISKPQAPYYPKLWSIAILISTGILYIMYELLQTLSTWKNQEQWNHFHVLQIIASAEGSLYFNKTFSEIHHRHSFIQMEYTMRLFQLYSLHTTSSRKEACCYTVALASLHLQCWSSLPAGSHQPPQSVISVAIGIQHV